MQDDTTDSWESGFQHANAIAVGALSNRIVHVENRPLKLIQCDLTKLKTTCANMGETHIQIGAYILGSDFGSDAKTVGDKDEFKSSRDRSG